MKGSNGQEAQATSFYSALTSDDLYVSSQLNKNCIAKTGHRFTTKQFKQLIAK